MAKLTSNITAKVDIEGEEGLQLYRIAQILERVNDHYGSLTPEVVGIWLTKDNEDNPTTLTIQLEEV